MQMDEKNASNVELQEHQRQDLAEKLTEILWDSQGLADLLHVLHRGMEIEQMNYTDAVLQLAKIAEKNSEAIKTLLEQMAAAD